MLLLVLALAAVSGAPGEATAPAAPAAGPATVKPVTVVKPVAAPDKVRCVSMSDTGSNFQRKECHTNQQWQAIKATESEYLRDQQVEGPMPSHPGPG